MAIESAGERFAGIDFRTLGADVRYTSNGATYSYYPAGWGTRYDNVFNAGEERAMLLDSCKSSIHPKGDKKPEGEPETAEVFRMTMLARGGPWRQQMYLRNDPAKAITVCLKEIGDYAYWEEANVEHTWEAMGDASMLTLAVRWVADPKAVEMLRGLRLLRERIAR